LVRGEATITNRHGIHARPSTIIAKEALRFDSTIMVSTSKGEVPADEVMAVLSLGIESGDTVTITVDGADEAEALSKMIEYFSYNYDFKRE